MTTIRNARQRKAVKARHKEDSRTIQSAKDETDVNVLVKKFQRGQPLPPSDVAPYLDVSDVPNTLLGMYDAVQRAEDAFAVLPSAVRKVAGNTWQGMVHALSSEEGPQALQDAGFDLGLEPSPDPTPPPDREAPPASEDAPEPSPAAQPDA